MILHAVQTFAGRPDEVFPFFADAHNLERITPRSLKFRVLTERPIEMGEGTTIDYALRINGIPVRWRSEITNWHFGYRFTDRQLRGPYRKWVHEHRFEPRGADTEMHDRIEYEVAGPAFIERRIVRPQLLRIFEHRQQVLRWLFGELRPGTICIGESSPAPEASRVHAAPVRWSGTSG